MKEEQRPCQHIMVSPLDGLNTSSYPPTSSRRSHVFSELHYRPCGVSGGIPHPTLRVWSHHVPPAGRSATAWLSCVDEVKSLPAGNLPYRPLYPRLMIYRGAGIIASSPSPKWTWRWTADLGRIGRIGPQD